MIRSFVRWDMTVAVAAIYEDGVLKLEKPVPFEEHAKVRVTIEDERVAPAAGPADDDPTGWKALRGLIGIIKDAPPDVSEKHDKYLYGDPAK